MAVRPRLYTASDRQGLRKLQGCAVTGMLTQGGRPAPSASRLHSIPTPLPVKSARARMEVSYLWSHLAERELSPQSLYDDIIFSYYVEGCMEGCMRDCMVRYFSLTPRCSPRACPRPHSRAASSARAAWTAGFHDRAHDRASPNLTGLASLALDIGFFCDLLYSVLLLSAVLGLDFLGRALSRPQVLRLGAVRGGGVRGYARGVRPVRRPDEHADADPGQIQNAYL